MNFLSPASFWLPDFFSVTGWERHIPFAFYLVDTLRPKLFVELGTWKASERYPFSRLIRADFADAAAQFDDGSIDLLHIDGDHHYESVLADFRNYQAKLSPDAIVLFHDTRLGAGSGVWRVFEGLPYPKFEFFHSEGLGMVAMGKIKDELRSWFEGPRQHLDWARRIYVHLGDTLQERANQDIDTRIKLAQYMVNQTVWALTS